MSRALKVTIGILAALVIVALVVLPGLRKAIRRVSGTSRTAEEARHDVMQFPISTPTDMQVKARMYWLSATTPNSLEPTVIELPLSADAAERAKQLINALIANAPSPSQRILPPDATLLAFYLQPDGTGIADFSDALAGGIPSGILSEQIVVDSITRTLAANVNSIRQLKILIHGQQADTLAGHLDLTGLFDVAPAPGDPTGGSDPSSDGAASKTAKPR